MKGSALRFLSVDLYKTLIYPKENIPKTYAKFGQKHLNFDFDCHILANNYADVFSAVEKKWPNFGRFYGVSAQQWWNEIIVRLFIRSSPFSEKHVRNTLPIDVTNEIYDQYATKDVWDLIPGSIEGLTKLKDAGIKLAICSNSDERTPIIVKAFDLDQFFSFSLYSQSCDYMKPDPGIFYLVCNRFEELAGNKLGLSSRMKQYGHVGDSESRDYWGARNAGCGRAFLLMPHMETPIDWPYRDNPAKLSQILVPTQDQISSLSEILERL